MADITLSSGDSIRPYRTPWGNFPIIGMALSTGISSATIRVGQVVVLDVGSTSYTNCIIPAALSSGTVTSTAIVGIAAENPGALSSTNTQGTVIPVWDANPHVEYRARTRGALLNSTLVGQVKNIAWDSTLTINLIDVGAGALTTALPRVIITSLLDNSGDSGGAVTFKFITRDPGTSTTGSGCLAFYK